ncbi:PAS domain-containing protein [Candidatus Reidiella endopervernicosa]|uniref:PAS domain-containing protein n=1 Tax=Candidatus Reidiella endopervernicosa TaxID=2738883 RepID=A0A6N0HSF0_9GAMM|nr:PAS domain-containing protein [Candidatus Reidiella endopervernicosa]QKQ25127.1 PAS domain-containing protein [Candidatus Reidiella endopervernicosa]
MKQKITPNNREVKLADDEFIVSKTDIKGRITYCNRVFMKIAGYSEKELLNTQHNVVRHPDMPRSVFRFLWQTLEQGQEFFGFVKNMTSDGSYYWVFANVTPDYDRNGDLKGYFSVRRKPKQAAIDALTPVYQEMLAIEQRVGPREGDG